jgi:WD40 repeat protein/tRNA A-37 threonylcarbamoyl transferase component Bud32
MMMVSMTDTPHCSECGAEIPADRPHGLCPQCLLAGGLAAGDDTETLATAIAPADASLAQPPAESLPLGRFGDYELLEEIARGGMGVVYKARQKSLNRIVAIKMILAGQFASKQIAQRFKSEAGAAAILQHPSIVAVHEVGVHDGQHFFSMDYVEGQNLSQLVGNRPLAPQKAARYVKLVAEAIHYAHQQGILHRDLKPSNVLIDAATDQPRVTDFGLAKRLDGESSLTVTGQVLGSPNFMPPEQASGTRGKVGRQSDVYGLGGILYFLLTARAPFQGESLEAILGEVLHREPVAPRLLNPSVPRDLETICLKCLEKEPEKRYTNAQALAGDLGRFLNDEPIAARPVGLLGKTWRWCRRKPLIASFAAATALLLLTVGIGSPLAALRIDREREKLRLNLYAADMKLAHQAWRDGLLEEARQVLDRHRPVAGQKDLRGFEWRLLWRLLHEAEPAVSLKGIKEWGSLRRVGDILYHQTGSDWKAWRIPTWDELRFAHDINSNPWWCDERRLTAFEADDRARTLTVHELPSLTKRATIALPGPRDWITMAPDRQTLGIGFKNGDRYQVMIWDLARDQSVGILGSYGQDLVMLEFSPDSRKLLVGCRDQTIDLWDVQALNRLPGHSRIQRRAFQGQFTPDGQTVVLTAHLNSPQVTIWNWHQEQEPTVLEHPPFVNAHDIASDGSRLATGAWDGTVRIWDRHTLRLLWNFKAHRDRVTSVVFSPDNRRLATGGTDRVVRVWDLDSQTSVADIRGHLEEVTSVEFSGDGQSLFTVSSDGAVKVWDIRAVAHANQLVGHSAYVRGLAVWPDETRLVSVDDKGVLKIWDTITRTEISSYQADSERVMDIALSPNTNHLAWISHTALTVVAFQTQRTNRLSFEYHDYLIKRVRFSPDSREVAYAVNQQVRRLQIETQESSLFATCKGIVLAITYASGGKHIVTGDHQGWVMMWDRQTRKKLFEDRAHSSLARDVQVSIDGKRLATCGWDGILKLWRVEGDQLHLEHTAPRQTGALIALAFSPDGTRLFSVSRAGDIKIWKLDPFQDVAELRHEGGVIPAVISPDGNTFYSAGLDRTIRAWPTASFAEADTDPLYQAGGIRHSPR